MPNLDTSQKQQDTKPRATSTRFGKYEVLGPLAEGGMAKVHLALKDGAESICVLKRLRLDMSDNAVTSKRFEREANLIAQLSHPNIAQVTDAGREQSCFYIAMEYIAGTDVEAMMHKLMDEGRMLPYVASIYIGLQTLKALAYAHHATDAFGETLDLVHRDLSPRNIMVSFEGDIKVIDFGLARGKIDDFKTAPGMLMGTLRYISPEQALAIPVDARSDLYTISVLLWEMLTGRFLINSKNTSDILRQVVHEEAPAISDLNTNLPRALDAVIAKGLAKEPEDRWASAQEYYEALYEAAGELTKLDPNDIGLFARQLFPEDFAKARHQESQADLDANDVNVKTVAQEVIMPTRTSFIIPERPSTFEPNIAQASPPKVESLELGENQTESKSNSQIATFVLCLAILASTAFIGARFLEQLVKVPTKSAPVKEAAPPQRPIIRATPKPGAKPRVPAPKPPHLREIEPKKVKKARPAENRKLVLKAPKKIPARNPLKEMRATAIAMSGADFDPVSWAKLLDAIKKETKTVRTQSDRQRIEKLARKGMAFQKAQYFVRAIDELERVK